MTMPSTGSWRVMYAVVAVIVVCVSVAHAQGSNGSDAVVPFRIQIPDSVLTDLKQRLARARFADEFTGADWNYGTNLAYLQELVTYWRDKYDWRVHERRLNQFDQFKTTIDGVEIHFVHQRSKAPNAMPLLLLNGWPSSIVEYEKVIMPLSENFHVVVPSMPGFGFSGKPRQAGYDVERIAGMWVQLMARLGYARYAVHGSDWGSNVANRMALRDAAHVAALHMAGCGGAAGPANQPPPAAPERNALVNGAHNVGYQEIQSTKPQTLGHALSDSPTGPGVVDRREMVRVGRSRRRSEKVFTKDQLLTNVMIYWVTNSGASSARIYQEGRHMGGDAEPDAVSASGCARHRADRLRGVPVAVRPPRGSAEPEPRRSPQGRRGAVQHRPLHADGARRAFPGDWSNRSCGWTICATFIRTATR